MFKSVFLWSTLLALASLKVFVLVRSQDASLVQNANLQVTATAAAGTAPVETEESKRFEAFKSSPLYLAPFEPEMKSIPEPQIEFTRSTLKKNVALYRQILKFAIDKRNSFAPSVALTWNYSGKLLSSMINDRIADKKLHPRIDPKSGFFEMLANIIESILDKSALIKKEKGYSKVIQPDVLYDRVDSIFNYTLRIVNISPVGGYLKWSDLHLFKDEPTNLNYNKPLIEEASDLAAQFRAMGYEKCTFVARRIVNMLRMFAKGMVPSEKDVR